MVLFWESISFRVPSMTEPFYYRLSHTSVASVSDISWATSKLNHTTWFSKPFDFDIKGNKSNHNSCLSRGGNRFPAYTILRQQIEISRKEIFAVQLIFMELFLLFCFSLFPYVLLKTHTHTQKIAIQFGLLFLLHWNSKWNIKPLICGFT